MPEQPNAPSGQRVDKLTRPRVRRKGPLTKAQREETQTAFLDAFKRNANITAACQKAHISRESIYTWLEHDEAFSLRFHQAELEANDMLLAAAWQRGVLGVEEPVVSMGNQVFVNGQPLTKRVYSDSVLLRLMSYRIPGFKEATGTTINNVNVQVERNELYARMSESELDQLEQLYAAAQERRKLGS